MLRRIPQFLWKSFFLLTLAVLAGCNGSGNTSGSGPNLASVPTTVASLSVSGSSSLTAGICAAFTVQTVDASGIATTLGLGTNTTFVVSPGGSAAIFSDSACTAAATSIPLSSSGTATFYVSDSVRESLSVAVSIPGMANPTTGKINLSVGGASAVSLGLNLPSSEAAYSCVPVTVSTYDNFGNLTTTHASLTTNLSLTGSSSTNIFSDAGCSAVINSIAIPSGVGAETFYLESFSTGNEVLAADTSGLTSASANTNFLEQNSPRLILTGPTGNNLVGSCASVEVQLQRADGSALPVISGSMGVNLSVSAGKGVTLASDSGCNSPLASDQIDFQPGASEVTIYVKTTQAPQTVSLLASANNFVSAQLNLNWSPLPATQLAIQGAPSSVPAGKCVAAQVSLLDSQGNAAYVTSNTTVNLSELAVDPTQTQIYGSSDCSGGTVSNVMIPICQGLGTCSNGLTISLRPKLVGQSAITAASSGGLLSATYSFTVTTPSGTPYSLVLTQLNSPIVAGSCSQIEVDTKDSFGNFINVSPSNLVLNAATVGASGQATVFSDSACSSASNQITVPAGAHSIVFGVSDPKAESLLITLSGPSSLVGQTSFTQIPGPAEKLIFTGVPSSFVATRCSGAISVTEQDAFGNSTLSAVIFNLSGSNGVNFFSDSGCLSPIVSGQIIAGASASTSLYFSGSNLGTASLTATATSPSTVVVPATAKVNFAAAPAWHLTMGCSASNPTSASCGALTAGACFPVYVESLDSNNQPYVPVESSLQFQVSTNSQNASLFYSNSTCTSPLSNNSFTISNGTNPAVFYMRDTAAENFTVTADSSSGVAGTLGLQIAAGAAYQLIVDSTVTPSTFLTGDCVGGNTGYPVYVRDQFGNPATVPLNTPLTFATSTLNGTGVTNATFFSDANCSSQSWTIPANSGVAYFHIKSASAGSLTAIPTAQNISQSVSRTFLVSQRAALAYKVNGLSIASINFGNVSTLANSVQLVGLSNTSTGDTALVSGITLPSSAYSLDSATTTCPLAGSFQLTAGQSCNLGIKFSPASPGSFSGNVVSNFVSQSDPTVASSASLAVSGVGTAPTVSPPQLSLSNISFGSALVGSPETQLITLSNPNETALTITGVSGLAAPFSVVSASPCGTSFPFNLAASASCSLTVQFAPTAAGSFSGSLTYSSSAGNSNTATLSGTGYTTSLNAPYLTYLSISFGTVQTGTTLNESISLVNPNSQSISVTALNGLSAPFAIGSASTCASTFPFTLAANGSCTLSIAFTPTANGNFSATVTYVTSAGNSNTAALSGIGASQTLESPWLSYSSISFGSIAVGSNSSQVMTLNNPNPNAISITAVQGVSGAFSISSGGTCGTSFPFTIAADSSCSLTVVFTPAAAASYSGSLTYESSAGNSNTTSLSGSGNNTSTGSLSFDYSAVEFQEVQVGSQSTEPILLTNNGTMTATAISLTGSAVGNTQGLTIQSTTCGTSLAPGSSCFMEAIFAPSANGSVTSSFQVTYQQNGSSFTSNTVQLSGTGY